MRNIYLLLTLLSLNAPSFAQTNPQPASAPHVAQPQIQDLPLQRDSQPLVLFALAAKDKAGRCKAHHRRLEVAVVPIVYGLLPGLSKEFAEAERRRFPNAIVYYAGGCLVLNAQVAKALQCPQCVAARAAYRRRLQARSFRRP